MAKKKNRLLIIFGLALLSGALAGFLALRQMDGSNMPTLITESRASTIQLAVAAHDLAVGTVLQNEDIRLVNWPEQVLPLGYLGAPDDLVGRGLMSEVKANEPLLVSKLADREFGGGLPILIPDGMRAVSVRVDDVIAVAGYVLPGTRVDVLVTVAEATNVNPITRVVLQNVRVMAAGQTLARDEEGRPQSVSVVTLLVTPEDGEKLVLGATQGRVQLALRNMLDDAESTTRGAAVANLVSASTAPPATARPPANRPPPQPQAVVETIRGGQRTLNNFSIGQ
jgi:pilus assembly protein CpaB